MKFRVAVGQFRELRDEDLAFARQIGVCGIGVNKPNLESPAWTAVLGRQFPANAAPRGPMQRWEAADLVTIRSYVEDAGLTLECIEGVPINFFAKSKLPDPPRGEEVGDEPPAVPRRSPPAVLRPRMPGPVPPGNLPWAAGQRPAGPSRQPGPAGCSGRRASWWWGWSCLLRPCD